MQVSVEAGDGLERRMKVELPFEEVSEEVEKRLQKHARSARLPGFRPGKVPMKVLRQRYGGQLFNEVMAEKVQSSLVEALAQESLQVAGMPSRIEPDVDVTEKRVAFTAVFEVMPELELASLDGRVVKRPVSEVRDADLDAMLQRLREQHKTWRPVERAAETGDRLTISFSGTTDGEAFEGGSSSGVKLELGSGRMIPGFETGLVGATAGETRTLDLTFPDPYRAEHLAGKPVRFEVGVDEVAEPALPEIDAELAKTFGIEDGDVERFKAGVRANMERELKDRIQARTKKHVMDILLEANDIQVPNALVEKEIESMGSQMKQALGGLQQVQLPSELLIDAARRRVALGLILGQVVKEKEIEVDEGRVRQMVEDMAASYEHPQTVIDHYYSDSSRLDQVRSLVLEEQVVERLIDEMSVEDEALTFEELTQPKSADSAAQS